MSQAMMTDHGTRRALGLHLHLPLHLHLHHHPATTPGTCTTAEHLRRSGALNMRSLTETHPVHPVHPCQRTPGDDEDKTKREMKMKTKTKMKREGAGQGVSLTPPSRFAHNPASFPASAVPYPRKDTVLR